MTEHTHTQKKPKTRGPEFQNFHQRPVETSLEMGDTPH